MTWRAVSTRPCGSELWDAGVGRGIAADRAWLDATAGVHNTDADDVNTTVAREAMGAAAVGVGKGTAGPAGPAGPAEEEEHEAAVYLVPEGVLGTVAAWGLDSRGALRAVEAPNAMPPEQAFLAGRCRLTVSQPVLKAPVSSALEAAI
jgi:hypothetical protein